jgi:hypothetical protein
MAKIAIIQQAPAVLDRAASLREADADAVAAARRRIDVPEHYARRDVFRLHVNRQRQSPVGFH